MGTRPVIVGGTQILAHAPELVFSGSKTRREMRKNPELHARLAENLRSLDDAASYLPNHIFIGAAGPRPLTDPARPWWSSSVASTREGEWGLLYSQQEFLDAMVRLDASGLLDITAEARAYDTSTKQAAYVNRLSAARPQDNTSGAAEELVGAKGALGTVAWGYPGDDSLAPHVIVENIANKTSSALALAQALDAAGVEPDELDLVISCSEDAVGDRYQRGGGNMGKAIAEAVGAGNASGFDVKNFCAAPVPALVVASALINSGVARTVAVAAGGCTAKLGMKFQGHLDHGMPILEDCLGAFAFILQADGDGPAIRLDAVGKHPVSAGGSNQMIFEQLVFAPLASLGLKVTDVGAFGTELHNPELTEPQGSGDVPLRNYKMIAAMAARNQHIDRAGIDSFLATRAFAGFAPTQGHIASGVCVLPYVLSEMARGRMVRSQLIAKASLFLGKMSGLSDGASVIVEV